jgi:hypothetical protein
MLNEGARDCALRFLEKNTVLNIRAKEPTQRAEFSLDSSSIAIIYDSSREISLWDV